MEESPAGSQQKSAGGKRFRALQESEFHYSVLVCRYIHVYNKLQKLLSSRNVPVLPYLLWNKSTCIRTIQIIKRERRGACYYV